MTHDEVSVVSSYDEWSPLKEVILGHSSGFRALQLDDSFCLFHWDNLKEFITRNGFFQDDKLQGRWRTIEIEGSILDELAEDLEGLETALVRQGITVRRPAPTPNPHAEIQTPFWKSIQSPPLNVRDQTIILGSTIVETAPQVRARVLENQYLRPLFQEYFTQGARWLSMPQPSLARGSLDDSFFDLSPVERKALSDPITEQLVGLSRELAFDGAQTARLGKDVLVNVANANHALGYDWLVREFGSSFKFHKLNRLSDSHIDSMLLPLRPGLWLVRHRGVLDYLPAPFHTWDYLEAPEVDEDNFPSYSGFNLSISSKFIDMNILSLDADIVVVNSLYPELVHLLERNKFTVIPVQHRHRRLFGGGFHCFTLDVRRTGTLEDYTT